MSFATDMGVWRCHTCNSKIYKDPVFIDGHMYCKDCSKDATCPKCGSDDIYIEEAYYATYRTCQKCEHSWIKE